MVSGWGGRSGGIVAGVFLLLFIGGVVSCTSSDDAPPLDQFLAAAFTGEEGALARAVVKYGDSTLLTEDLSVFVLTRPVVLDTTVDAGKGVVCYRVEAGAGVMRRQYRFCWKNDRLVGVADLGMVTDE